MEKFRVFLFFSSDGHPGLSYKRRNGVNRVFTASPKSLESHLFCWKVPSPQKFIIVIKYPQNTEKGTLKKIKVESINSFMMVIKSEPCRSETSSPKFENESLSSQVSSWLPCLVFDLRGRSGIIKLEN